MSCCPCCFDHPWAKARDVQIKNTVTTDVRLEISDAFGPQLGPLTFLPHPRSSGCETHGERTVCEDGALAVKSMPSSIPVLSATTSEDARVSRLSLIPSDSMRTNESKLRYLLLVSSCNSFEDGALMAEAMLSMPDPLGGSRTLVYIYIYI